jgi:putative PIG3 family NAD(P)H quinone oxidoreductase
MQLDYSGEPIDGRGAESSVDPASAKDVRATMSVLAKLIFAARTMPNPNTMRYIAAREPGPPDVLMLAETSVPKPRGEEVLIEVAYAGVNRPDLLQRAGAYPPPPDASPIIGLEVAGKIVATGENVRDRRIGEVVCALTPGGGYAEYCTTPAAFCLPFPRGLSALEAAGLPENYFTVWNNVFDRVHLAAGETILIHGGSGGIGLTAIQLAKAFGATAIATVGSAEKADFCRGIGADHAINYREQDFVAEVAAITSKRGVDIVLDIVGGDYFEKNLRCLALEGRLAIIAFLQGSRVTLDFRHVMLRRLTITGSTLRASTVQRKAEIAISLREKVWPLFEAGRLKAVVHRVFPFAEAAAAHALMESGAHIGKIMLEVAPAAVA